VKVDVFLSPGELAPSSILGRVVAVIDVLRASTSIATALDNGARTVVPVESTDIALMRAKQFERDKVVLAGEIRMQPIPGFDLGNSPREFTSEVVGDKTVLMTTTNGTRALMGLQGARDVIVVSYVNHSAAATMLRTAARANENISIVCAGHEGHFSLEDAACAGRLVRSISLPGSSLELNDAAHACELIDGRYGDNIAKIFEDSVHGKALTEAGFGDDLIACAALDSHPVVPIYSDRQITRIGPDRER
jgi:2-phosphosulfolactate phosphatase